MKRLMERVRRAARKTPRELAARLVQMGWAHLQRPWSRLYPNLLTDGALLRATEATSIDALWEERQRAPFFVSSADRHDCVQRFRERYPETPALVVTAADRVCRHEFDLLGSGRVTLDARLPWHTDFKSGREWPVEYAPQMEYLELDRPSDVKVPWELSRCQHFTMLGQAYWLTGDERYAQEFVDETSDWIARNPWALGVNWACAMDVALRAVSWIWAFYFFSDAVACRSQKFRRDFLRSLYMHGEYVASHLEHGEVNGNHYLCDGVGLVFLGTFFRSTSKGRSWLKTGRQIVDAEIFNQTTADGVDFEKSTAYQRLVLEAFLTSGLLLQLHQVPLSRQWLERLERMIEFVEAYTKPDGTIPLIGDADDGRIQKLGLQRINDHRYLIASGAVLFGRADFKRAAGRFGEEAFWLLGRDAAGEFDRLEADARPVASKAFADGGYYVLRSDRAHVIVDCGEVGMHGRGGHGHSDITSLEVWVDGLNIVTDCGAYLYTASREWRNQFRGTPFHNVVQIDGEELNRLITPDHLWQLRDDARPRAVSWRFDEGADYFCGAHTGYERLSPPVLVTREVLLVKDGPDLLVRDSVEGEGSRELVWRFHLDPALDAEPNRGDIHLHADGRDAWLQTAEEVLGAVVTIEDGWVSPSYGVRARSKVVVVTARARLPVVATFRIGLARLGTEKLETLMAALPSRNRTCVNC
jgi:uncharacterized heparinase superfamily protein